MIQRFSFAATPHIYFGAGERAQLLPIVRSMGKRVLLLTGGHAFDASPLCMDLWQSLQQECLVFRESVSGEPSPSLVDDMVARYHTQDVDVVVALGGGSVVDAAKAVAGLLPSGDSVMAYLEGVGKGMAFSGSTTPFIAIPTTAGTGGETSKNAVLSVVGRDGFKKSFRHPSLVPKYIILDSELTQSCPPEVTAACGLDACTQLMESYVSIKANPMTDALAWSGLQHIRQGLLAAVHDGGDIHARSCMLYASSLSGLTLANAGLGSVHGLASPLGAFFPIPHGVACGALLYEAIRTNIQALQQRQPNAPALVKYAEVGRLFAEDAALSDAAALSALLDTMLHYTKHLKMPKLSQYGVCVDDIPRLIAHISGGSMSGNPIVLTDDELHRLLHKVM